MSAQVQRRRVELVLQVLLTGLAIAGCRASPVEGIPEAAEDAGSSPSPAVRGDPLDVGRRIEEWTRSLRADPRRPEDVAWVRERLAKIVGLDQRARFLLLREVQAGGSEIEREVILQALAPAAAELDRRNTGELKDLLAVHGWIRISEFGRKADHDAWLIVQHSDHDPAFQAEVLILLEDLIPRGDTEPGNYASLFDRVAVADGRPQRYGTQGVCASAGAWEPFPIEDPAKLDARRESVGLMPFEEYARLASEFCQ